MNSFDELIPFPYDKFTKKFMIKENIPIKKYSFSDIPIFSPDLFYKFLCDFKDILEEEHEKEGRIAMFLFFIKQWKQSVKSDRSDIFEINELTSKEEVKAYNGYIIDFSEYDEETIKSKITIGQIVSKMLDIGYTFYQTEFELTLEIFEPSVFFLIIGYEGRHNGTEQISFYLNDNCISLAMDDQNAINSEDYSETIPFYYLCSYHSKFVSYKAMDKAVQCGYDNIITFLDNKFNLDPEGVYDFSSILLVDYDSFFEHNDYETINRFYRDLKNTKHEISDEFIDKFTHTVLYGLNSTYNYSLFFNYFEVSMCGTTNSLLNRFVSSMKTQIANFVPTNNVVLKSFHDNFMANN